MLSRSQISLRIILVGGGHSHIQFVKDWVQRPIPGVEVILISKTLSSVYSGMLPGRIAGWYEDHEIEFNLAALCSRAQIRFLHAEVTSVDHVGRKVFIENYPELSYDVASINVGISPQIPEGLWGHVLPVKPIGDLVKNFSHTVGAGTVAVIGGGAAGFELACMLSLVSRRQNLSSKIVLLEKQNQILSSHGLWVRHKALRILKAVGVQMIVDCEVHSAEGGFLNTSRGRIAFDKALVTTHAMAPRWLKDSGLPVDEYGAVRIDSNLMIEGVLDLFACGDMASLQGLPKSGVIAVRQGPILIENLRRRILGYRKLRKYRPQKFMLALLCSGDRRALLSYGPFAFEGNWIWKLKDFIDRRFMRMFGGMNTMGDDIMEHNTCDGCGGKVAGQLIEGLVHDLKLNANFSKLLPSTVEDVGWLDNFGLTIDGFRSFDGDLKFFGKVAVLHALNDLFASGCIAEGVLISVGLPAARDHIRKDHLRHLMEGVLEALSKFSIPLLNAHTAESSETSLVVQAIGKSERPWSKHGLRVGDQLLLTKPIGTGVLLQGFKQGILSVQGFSDLRRHLLKDHGFLVEKLAGLVTACTDVTGFGLIGHLNEMLAGDHRLNAQVDIQKIPLLADFERLVGIGVKSYISEANQLKGKIDSDRPLLEKQILSDPQTHGPLLIGVKSENLEKVLQVLSEHGFAQAACIGQIVAGPIGSATFDVLTPDSI